MKRTILFAVAALILCANANAAGVAVTKPVKDAVCTIGHPCAIAWTVAGTPGSKVMIELLGETAPTVLRLLASDVPIGNLQYAWTVPSDVAAGKYRIQVRVVGASVFDIGDVFKIQAQSGLHAQAGAVRTPLVHQAPASNLPPHIHKDVIISYPANMVEWELNHPYTIRWTAGTVPDDGFEVDLYRGDGTKAETLLSGAARPEGPYSWSFEWKPWCNIPVGIYRIRIKSWLSGATATSGQITLIVRTKKLVENIPVQVENADIFYGTTSALIECSRVIPPGKGRVGYDYSAYQGNSSYHAFRTRLTFDLSRFNGKKGVVEKAVLIQGDAQGCPGNEHPFCGARLYALGAGEVGRWNGTQATAVPYQLTGWWAPYNPTGFDITAAVQDWLNKTKPNHGLVMVSGNDGFSVAEEGHAEVCVSFFKPIMYVTFIEKPDPCAPSQ